ncbi:MAG: hypothetical protein FJZ59_00885 [Chlamydiae bacterium]|nr:hypothetical protein [Chlamydiota bacterium]
MIRPTIFLEESELFLPPPLKKAPQSFLSHIFGKYVTSRFILPSSSTSCRRDFVTKQILQETTSRSLLTEISETENISSAKEITLKTDDEIHLDGIEIISKAQENFPPHEQKWSILALPNLTLWQQICHLLLIPFTSSTEINLLCVNYRMTGNSEKKRPSSFDEICLDIDAAVQELLKRGVNPKNILLHGISLGGATALHVANHYQKQGISLTCIVQNTFNKAQEVVPEGLQRLAKSIYKQRLDRILTQESTKTTTFDRALLSLRDAFFSLPHLALRVRLLATCILGNLLRCNLIGIKENVIDLLKTICFDVILTLTGFLSFFLSPFTNRLNHFNASLNRYFLDNSLLLAFITSSKIEWVARKIVAYSGWDPDNEKIINYTKQGNIFFTPTDGYIKEEASLATPFKEKSFPNLQIIALPERDDDQRQLDHSDIAGNFSADYQTPRSTTFQEVDGRFSQIIEAFKSC